VVNYLVIVEADNPDGKLFPYMTATVSFEEPKRAGVLVVPNAALRWKPKSESSTPATDGKTAGGHRLWIVARSGSPEPIEVDVGPTDGTVTEVCGGNVKEGMSVILGVQSGQVAAEQDAAGGDDAKSNMPFMPKFPKKGPPKGPGGPPPG
jgi:HlyD family secretion protein